MKHFFFTLVLGVSKLLLPAQTSRLPEAQSALLQDITVFQTWLKDFLKPVQLGMPMHSEDALNAAANRFQNQSTSYAAQFQKTQQTWKSANVQKLRTEAYHQYLTTLLGDLRALDQQTDAMISLCASFNVEHQAFSAVVRNRLAESEKQLDAVQKESQENLTEQFWEDPRIANYQAIVEKCKGHLKELDSMAVHITAFQNLLHAAKTNLSAAIDSEDKALHTPNGAVNLFYQKSADEALTQLFNIL